MPFVVDASMTLTWAFDDEATAATEAMLDRFQAEGIVVPALWPVEVANGLLVGQRRSRISPERSESFLVMLEGGSVTIASQSFADTQRSVLRLARQHGLTAYDASYLELAIRLRLPLVTLDIALRAAAQREGVVLL